MESHTPDPIREAARHEQNQHGDPRTHAAPTKTSRGGWKWGDSQSSRIRNAAADYLREKGEPATGPEICDAIMKMGVSIKGQRPEKAVTAKLRPRCLTIRVTATFCGNGRTTTAVLECNEGAAAQSWLLSRVGQPPDSLDHPRQVVVDVMLLVNAHRAVAVEIAA